MDLFAHFRSACFASETLAIDSATDAGEGMIDTVLGVQELRNRKHWSSRDIDRALSPEALTAAVMQRYHVAAAAKREISHKLRRPQHV